MRLGVIKDLCSLSWGGGGGGGGGRNRIDAFFNDQQVGLVGLGWLMGKRTQLVFLVLEVKVNANKSSAEVGYFQYQF